MTGGRDPRGEVDVVPHIAFVGDERRAHVHADAQLNRAFCERFGDRLRRCDGSRCRGEGEEECVSLRVDLDAARRGARQADRLTVLGECLRIGLRAELVQKPRRAFDVGEQQRYRPGR